jgi:hypothetical protein
LGNGGIIEPYTIIIMPKGSMLKVLKFLGLPPSKFSNILDSIIDGQYKQEFTTFTSKLSIFHSADHFSHGLTATSVDKWRMAITDGMMFEVEKNCQPAMKKLGYINNQTDFVKTAYDINS